MSKKKKGKNGKKDKFLNRASCLKNIYTIKTIIIPELTHIIKHFIVNLVFPQYEKYNLATSF